MMLDVKVVTVTLDLSGYDAAYAGQAVAVWVNLPAPLLRKRADLLRGLAREIAAGMKGKGSAFQVSGFRRAWDAARRFFATLRTTHGGDALDGLMAEVWSAGADAESHWTMKEIAALKTHDPMLYAWMTRESWKIVDAWRADKKK